MPSKIRTVLISATGLIFLFAGMSFAKSTKVDVIYHTTIGKTLKLKPGNYRIDLANSKKASMVKFYNTYGKFVGQVPVKVASESGKNGQTEIDYNTVAANDHVITEISPRGWKENLYFSHSKATKANMKK